MSIEDENCDPEASPPSTSNLSQPDDSNPTSHNPLGNVYSFAAVVKKRYQENKAAMATHPADQSVADNKSPAPADRVLTTSDGFPHYVTSSLDANNLALASDEDAKSDPSTRSTGYLGHADVAGIDELRERMELNRSPIRAAQHTWNQYQLNQQPATSASIDLQANRASPTVSVPWIALPSLDDAQHRAGAVQPAPQLQPYRQPTLPYSHEDMELRSPVAKNNGREGYFSWSAARPDAPFPFPGQPSGRYHLPGGPMAGSHSSSPLNFSIGRAGQHTPDNGVRRQSNLRYHQGINSSSPVGPGSASTTAVSLNQVNTPATDVSNHTPASNLSGGGHSRNGAWHHGVPGTPVASPLFHWQHSAPSSAAPQQQFMDSENHSASPFTAKLGNMQISDSGNNHHFRPMESRLNIRDTTSQAKAYENMLHGFSPNYRGNIHLVRNKSADIPAEKNCSLFLLGLNASVTTHQLLSSIRNIGRVYATHINKPEPDKLHMTCAAKVTFFERQAAERFFDTYNATGFKVHGHDEIARVLWNRIRAAESLEKPHRTRVLQIAGPPDLVNPEALTAYFNSKLEFQIDEVILQGQSEERNVVEYRFGSYRCQAEAAKMALGREYPDGNVRTWHGPDPCDILDDDGQAIARY